MKRMFKTLALLTLGLLLARGAAAADAYEADKAHSQIGFAVSHMMISKVRGSFGDFQLDLQVDTADLSKSSVKATIQAASINTANAKRDEHLSSPDFFDVAKFPTITFTSKKIEKRGSQWVAVGDYTMHGVTKTIELPFTLSGPIQDPWGMTRIGLEATVTIDRQAYGVSYGSGMVGNDVEVQIQLEATKK